MNSQKKAAQLADLTAYEFLCSELSSSQDFSNYPDEPAEQRKERLRTEFAQIATTQPLLPRMVLARAVLLFLESDLIDIWEGKLILILESMGKDGLGNAKIPYFFKNVTMS